jgi:predicted CoA-substrate-specific enzyme activase
VSGATAIGVDVGSTTVKAVTIDGYGAIVARFVEPASPYVEQQTARALEDLLRSAGATAGLPVGATGYGRKRVTGATRVLTEITCHAAGAFRLIGRSGVLIDFGGQDTKVIRIGPDGSVLDFAMNDKCAAGTGRFLEVILGRLEVALAQAGDLAASAKKAVTVSSTCTVFAESEVISLVAQGEAVADIVAGLHRALAARVAALAGRMTDGSQVYMSGGVALNRAMALTLGEALGREVTVLPEPQLVGALGAALAVSPAGPS